MDSGIISFSGRQDVLLPGRPGCVRGVSLPAAISAIRIALAGAWALSAVWRRPACQVNAVRLRCFLREISRWLYSSLMPIAIGVLNLDFCSAFNLQKAVCCFRDFGRCLSVPVSAWRGGGQMVFNIPHLSRWSDAHGIRDDAFGWSRVAGGFILF